MERTLLRDGWEFSLDGGEYTPVTIPHDWLIHDAANLYQNGVGRYRRELDADAVSSPGQRLSLRFDGVYMDVALFVNGAKAGEWKYGYTAFEFDVTDYLLRGAANRIELEVNYKSPSARWYTGAGIYRDAFLIVKNPCHFISDGIYITTSRKNGEWEYSVTEEVETGGKPYETRHCLEEEKPYQSWDIDHPVLYRLHSELIVDGEVTDTAVTRFGFRETQFDPNRGFFLNGRHVRLNGVCLHHDLGALGSAVHKDAIRRQLTILRGMGVNAIRTSHNPPAEVFMELADEMGFLVMSELLDMWERPKGEFDYARFFRQWVERDAAAWIRRDRNCPSVILWSVGNEIYDTHADAERGGELLRMLVSYVTRHDPDSHALPTLCSNYMPWENTQKCADIIKVIGYNYAERLYESHHKAHPDWVIYGGETGSTVQSRGVYHFPLSQPTLSDDDSQCSSLGNSSTSWGAENTEAHILADRNTPFSLGQFVWAGQDYIGEPTPYHTKNSYFAPIDTAGFPKDAYYIFQAAWTDGLTSPMVHLYPYWDFSPGQMIDVRAASNAHSAEVFLNGVSQGRREIGGQLTASWRVPYEAGELRAVAYDPDGNPVAEDSRRSFGDAVRLRTEEDRFGELAFITITAEDPNGATVENANNRVRVTVRGGELLGLDNGDSTDYDSYKAGNRRLFSGKLLAIVKVTGDLRVEAELDRGDVPVRKIELSMEDTLVSAKVFPADAQVHGLLWRLTNAGGVDSPAATITAAKDGRSAVLAPHADGEVWIRCEAVNERGQVYLISQLPYEITGKGAQVLDPYAFIAGALYTESNIRLANGNERGVASARDEDSHIGFAGLDFGSYGSDELTVPLFPLTKEPFTFELWLGMPLHGGRKLTDVYYDKGSVWNTYIDVAIKLPERIKGPATLCFVFHQKVHLKGFAFTKYEKAFALLRAAENDGLSGDAYEVRGGAVEQIGNNVTLTFTDMDFGEAGASGVTLRTRSQLENNSVHLLFRGEAGQERREVLEVPGSVEYSERSFPFGGKVRGRQTVSFVFLPGSSIDVERVRFLQ